MIVVEGADGMGKSTLVQALSADLGLRGGTRGTPNRDELWKVTREDTYKALAHMVEGYHPPYIWDRLGPFSDPIYSRIMERPCAFELSEVKFATDIMHIARCPVIFCIVPLEMGQENILQGHQMDKVEENYPYIHGLYEGVALRFADWTWTYDYRDPDAYTDILEKCRSYTTKRKDREWH